MDFMLKMHRHTLQILIEFNSKQLGNRWILNCQKLEWTSVGKYQPPSEVQPDRLRPLKQLLTMFTWNGKEGGRVEGGGQGILVGRWHVQSGHLLKRFKDKIGMMKN